MLVSKLERNFINSYQGGFPLVDRPFRAIAGQLDTSESIIIETTGQLLEKGLLSRFGPLYDAVQLGGGLTLAALCVPENRYQTISKLVNSYPEVAHNYRREHELNMWFVLATRTPAEIEITIESIEQSTGLKVVNFPKQEEFYVGLWLEISRDGNITTVPLPTTVAPAKSIDHNVYATDHLDREIIAVSQAGLTLSSTPYHYIAEQVNAPPGVVVARLENMLSNGIIRRIGAVPNHYRLGLRANGMTVWDVADNQAQALGKIIGQLDYVSHCYLRPRNLPMWGYNLFAMVHGHSKDEVARKARQIEIILGSNCSAHTTLFSSAILKKTGMRLAA